MELQHNVAYHTTMSSKTNCAQPGRKEKEPVYDEVIIAGRKTVPTPPKEPEYEELT